MLFKKTASHFSGTAWVLSGNQVFNKLGFIPKPYFLLVAVHFLKTASHFSGTAWVLSGNQVFSKRGSYPKTVSHFWGTAWCAPNHGFCGLPIYPKTGRDIPLSFSHHHFSWFRAHFSECVSQALHPHKPSHYKVRQDRHRL